MDSREQPPPPPPPPPHSHSQHLPPLQPHSQHQGNALFGPNSYPPMISSQNIVSSGGYPFSSGTMLMKPTATAPSDGGARGGGGDGTGGGRLDVSSPPSGIRFSMESSKKKRGRPRKYAQDGNIALGLAPTTPISSATSAGHGDSSGGTPATASEPSTKKNRGRPPGSGKKQLDALGGFGGVGFTPHVITVKAGEDIASKIVAFSKQGPRTVCILSANGAVCNVTLRQPAISGGTVTYESRFEIISLSGSLSLSENNGGHIRDGGLSVSLAGSDGRVLGGGVAGMLVAASPVQVIVGSFIADGKKSNSNTPKSGSSSAPPQMLDFGAPLSAASPQGASSESSEEHGTSPVHPGPGIYGNSGQPMHNMHMYHLWAGQNQH